MAGPISETAASKSKPSNPNKRKLLDDSDSDSDDAGATIGGSGFKVNEEYARRFEHNKKREEKHRRTFELEPLFSPHQHESVISLTYTSGGEAQERRRR